MDFKQWEGFDKSGKWIDEINVRNFIQKNYTPYETVSYTHLTLPTKRIV